MAKVWMKLEGFDQYLEELVKAGKDIDQVAEECLEAGSEVLLAGMQRRAPHDVIKNALRKTEVMKDGDKRYLYLGILRDTDAETARIADVWEFGGPGKTGHGGKRKHRSITARPYIRPTLRSDAKKARAAQIEIFESWLGK